MIRGLRSQIERDRLSPRYIVRIFRLGKGQDRDIILDAGTFRSGWWGVVDNSVEETMGTP